MDTNHTNGYHDPVRTHSVQRINQLIDARIEENIATFRNASPTDVNERLAQLEEEWDAERVTLTNLGGLAALGGLLGLALGRKWFWLSALAGGFIIQQSVQGWSPPVSVARRFRVRSREEIAREYEALCNVLAERGELFPREERGYGDPGTHSGMHPGMGTPPLSGEFPPGHHQAT